MQLPIRITFRENADHFIEAQNQLPPPKAPISERTTSLFAGLLIGGILLYALGQEYRQGVGVGIILCGTLFFAIVAAFWLWLFKKLGWHKTRHSSGYKWTDKDRARLNKAYLKRVGREETMVVCEFNERGFSLQPENGKLQSFDWITIRKIIERPKGVLVFIRKSVYFWFPKRAFEAHESYWDFLDLAEKWAPGFQRLKLAFIALGSNLGDSRRILLDAIARLQNFSDEQILISTLWRTTPVDCPPGSPEFVNAVVGLTPQKDETPESLLGKLKALEKEFGRTIKKVLNEPRPLDLDLITFGNEIRNTSELILPHPRAHLRRFALQPLSEIAPDLILSGQTESVSRLAAKLQSTEKIERIG